MKLRFSRRAREDLLDTWAHVVADNIEAADRLFDQIEFACRRLRENPMLGVGRPAFGEGARILIVGKRLVLYRVTTEHIHVVRIVHGARDLSRLRL